jgi:SAM-dependent methyltransferase
MEKVEKVLKVIDYTKLTNNKYSGRNYLSGYHSFVLDGKLYKGGRDNFNRLNQIKNFDFSDKVVLDIGCNMGGMLHALANKIKYGVGIDFDRKCINAANAIKDLNKITNLNFYMFDLDKEDLNLIKNFILEDKIDICFFLSLAQYVGKWREVIQFCFNNSDHLLFESNGRLRHQENQACFIHNLYKKVEYIFSDGRRKMFLCSKI